MAVCRNVQCATMCKRVQCAELCSARTSLLHAARPLPDCQDLAARRIPKHAKKAKNAKKHCFYNEIMRKIGFSIAKKCEKTDS